VVDCLVAGGLVGLVGVHRSHEAAKGGTPDDAVHVGGGDTWLDDGVRSLNGERVAVHGEGIAK